MNRNREYTKELAQRIKLHYEHSDFSKKFIETLLEDRKYCTDRILKIASEEFNRTLSHKDAITVLQYVQLNIHRLAETSGVYADSRTIDAVMFGEQEEEINYTKLNFVPSAKILYDEGFYTESMKRYGNSGYIGYNLDYIGVKVDLSEDILDSALTY
jgi:hypothetical protein